VNARFAVKGIIPVENDRFIFVANSIGYLNLVGGGEKPEDGGDPMATFLRESTEEIGLGRNDLSNVRRAFPFRLGGTVTSAEGVESFAIWTVMTTDTCEVGNELYIPSGSEISDIACMSAQECFDHPNMSDLAKMAVSFLVNS
jgi:hypothetical protein